MGCPEESPQQLSAEQSALGKSNALLNALGNSVVICVLTFLKLSGQRSHLPSKLKPPGPPKKALKMLFASNSRGEEKEVVS